MRKKPHNNKRRFNPFLLCAFLFVVSIIICGYRSITTETENNTQKSCKSLTPSIVNPFLFEQSTQITSTSYNIASDRLLFSNSSISVDSSLEEPEDDPPSEWALSLANDPISDEIIKGFCNSLASIDGYVYNSESTGKSVQAIQNLLDLAGYPIQNESKSSYGPRTKASVLAFKENLGLEANDTLTPQDQFMLLIHAAPISFKDYENDARAFFVGNFGLIVWPGGTFFLGTANPNNGSYFNGTYFFSTGSYYAGEFNKKLRSGNGRAYFPNGDVYIGQWKKDKMDGLGTYYFGSFGSTHRYVGHWANGMMNGAGIYTLADGTVITGTWKKNSHKSWK